MQNVHLFQQAQAESQSKLLDNQQAAAFLGLRESTLNKDRCVKQLGIPFVKIGRTVRYRQTDLDSFVNSRLVR